MYGATCIAVCVRTSFCSAHRGCIESHSTIQNCSKQAIRPVPVHQPKGHALCPFFNQKVTRCARAHPKGHVWCPSMNRKVTRRARAQVRRFQQDDAHIFCTPEHVSSEISDMLAFIEAIYSRFGLGPCPVHETFWQSYPRSVAFGRAQPCRGTPTHVYEACTLTRPTPGAARPCGILGLAFELNIKLVCNDVEATLLFQNKQFHIGGMILSACGCEQGTR